MERQIEQKQMFSSTNRKEKIFNVRKVAYKPFEHDKCIFRLMKDLKQELCLDTHTPQKPRRPEYQFQVAIVSSATYRELHQKYLRLRDEQNEQKSKRIAALKQKEQELTRYQTEQKRLQTQRQKLYSKRDQLRGKIEELRERNEAMRMQQMERNEQYRIMNMEYLRNMIISMRYQNGLDIDPDTMTYEELLQLQEKMGSVSKGFSQAQIQQLQRKKLVEDHTEVCSICYYPAKAGEEIYDLHCGHTFHCDCIKEWLLKDRVCPLCKRQISLGLQEARIRENIQEGNGKNVQQEEQKKQTKEQQQQIYQEVNHTQGDAVNGIVKND